MAIQLSRLHKIFTLNNAFIHIELDSYTYEFAVHTNRLLSVLLCKICVYHHHAVETASNPSSVFPTHPKYFQKSTCSCMFIFRFVLGEHIFREHKYNLLYHRIAKKKPYTHALRQPLGRKSTSHLSTPEVRAYMFWFFFSFHIEWVSFRLCFSTFFFIFTSFFLMLHHPSVWCVYIRMCRHS